VDFTGICKEILSCIILQCNHWYISKWTGEEEVSYPNLNIVALCKLQPQVISCNRRAGRCLSGENVINWNNSSVSWIQNVKLNVGLSNMVFLYLWEWVGYMTHKANIRSLCRLLVWISRSKVGGQYWIWSNVNKVWMCGLDFSGSRKPLRGEVLWIT
jgi:hypothetical protein